MVDPAHIHAVAVGLERYPRHPEWNLPGAAGDAMRFAQWLRKGGVPSGNIQLLLAPVEGSLPKLDAQAREAQLTWCEAQSRDQLMDVFTFDLNSRAGEVLYVFWGSHGVLDYGDRRLLLCPDASLNDKRCIDVTDLREHLARADLPGFRKQVFFFDTCATFLEYHHQETGPAVAAFPSAPRRSIEQFLLHASAAGQVAENDAVLRSGVFSHAVLDWLEEHALDLRPDLTSLVEHAKGRFDELYTAGGPPQTPISVHIRALDGSEYQLYAGRDDHVHTLAAPLRNRLAEQCVLSDETPYWLPSDARPLLSQVYVPQSLDQRPDPGQKREKEQKRQPRDPVLRTIDEIIRDHHHAVVVGGPGYGKSSLALRVADRWGRPWIDGSGNESGNDRLIPLYVKAHNLLGTRVTTWSQALAAATGVPIGLLEAPVPGGSWLVLVDGLDEVTDTAAQDRIVSMLTSQAMRANSPYRLIVTTRLLNPAVMKALRSAAGGAEYALEPFDHLTLRAFATAWFGSRRAPGAADLVERFLKGIRRAALTDVARVPLLATIAAIMFEKDPGRTLPTSRYEMYEEYISYLMFGHAEEAGEQWVKTQQRFLAVPGGQRFVQWLNDQRLELVRHLARQALETGNRLTLEVTRWVETNASAAETMPEVRPPDWQDLLLTSVTTTGLVARSGQEIEFIHQSFAEHLAAAYYASTLPAEVDLSTPQWDLWVGRAIRPGSLNGLARQVLVHYTRKEPEAGLVSILQGHGDLASIVAAELLAYGAIAEPEALKFFTDTIDGFLRHTPRMWDRVGPAASGLLDQDLVRAALKKSLAARFLGPARRLNVARILLDSEEDQGMAVLSLHNVLRDRSADLGTQREAGRLLLATDPELVEVVAEQYFQHLTATQQGSAQSTSGDPVQHAIDLAHLEHPKALGALTKCLLSSHTTVSVQLLGALHRLGVRHPSFDRRIAALIVTRFNGSYHVDERLWTDLHHVCSELTAEQRAALDDRFAAAIRRAKSADDASVLLSLAAASVVVRRTAAAEAELRWIAQSTSQRTFHRLQALGHLLDIEACSDDEARRVIESVALAQGEPEPWIRVVADRNLGTWPAIARHLDAAAEILLTRETAPENLLALARGLARLQPDLYDSTVKALVDLALAPASPAAERTRALKLLWELGEQSRYVQPMASAARAIIDALGLTSGDLRLTLLLLLARLDQPQDKERIRDEIHLLACDREADRWLRVGAATALARIDDPRRAGPVLWQLALDLGLSFQSYTSLIDIGFALLGLDAESRAHGAALLAQMLGYTGVDRDMKLHVVDMCHRETYDNEREKAYALRRGALTAETDLIARLESLLCWAGQGPRHTAMAQKDIVAFVNAPDTPPRAAAEMLAVMRQAMGADAAATVLTHLLLSETTYEVKKKAIHELVGHDSPYFVAAACQIAIGGPDPTVTFLLQSEIIAKGNAAHDDEMELMYYASGRDACRQQIATTVLLGLGNRAREEDDPDLAPRGLRRLGLALHEQQSPSALHVFQLAARSVDVEIAATARHALALLALERGDTRQAVDHWTAAAAMGRTASAVDLALFQWQAADKPEAALRLLEPVVYRDALAAVDYATLVLMEFPEHEDHALSALTHWASEGTGVAAAYLAVLLKDKPGCSEEAEHWQRQAQDLGRAGSIGPGERILIQYGWSAV
ncbi:hypothetical protein ABZ865_00655 [Streptomyces sp. NPDC047085]|uniref:hypothetical protein n=1 Tax=Streptomyces sp. NPDC047085 TaxID=3155140 RepID=UPI0033D5F28E